MVNINSIEEIESLIDKRTKPLKKEICKLRFELEELKEALTIPRVTKRFFSWGDILIGFIAGVFGTIITLAYIF